MAVAVGSVLPWATARLDLSAVFELFPADYAQAVQGLELGGTVTLVAAGVLLVSGAAVAFDTRTRVAAGSAALAAGFGAALWGLYHVVRVRPLVLAALERASGRPAETFPADVSVGPGTFVVMAGALAAMAGGVLVLAGRAGSGRHGPGATTAAAGGSPAPAPG
jgi:hypothetical protein